MLAYELLAFASMDRRRHRQEPRRLGPKAPCPEGHRRAAGLHRPLNLGRVKAPLRTNEREDGLRTRPCPKRVM